jgi:hypothetical protein
MHGSTYFAYGSEGEGAELAIELAFLEQARQTSTKDAPPPASLAEISKRTSRPVMSQYRFSGMSDGGASIEMTALTICQRDELCLS